MKGNLICIQSKLPFNICIVNGNQMYGVLRKYQFQKKSISSLHIKRGLIKFIFKKFNLSTFFLIAHKFFYAHIINKISIAIIILVKCLKF